MRAHDSIVRLPTRSHRQSLHQHRNAVKANCGAEAVVDIDQAKKIYNDYCSANGFPIPGYTYIRTETVRLSTGTATAVAATPTVNGSGSAAGGGGTCCTEPW